MNEEIYRILQDRILFLEYEPGRILNEKVLAAEFGISRTPLREVLNRLEWAQLVRILPRTGTMVAEIDYQKMMNVYPIRLELEAMAGRLAAEHIAPGHLVRLAAVGERCAALQGIVDKNALVNIDFDFREIIYDAAENEVLTGMSGELYRLTVRLWYVTLDRKSWDEEVHAILNEITSSQEVLGRGDAPGMAELRRASLISHLERIRAKFLALC
ncbi:GntR family transcriptional regulator [Desulfococcus sp.]|uniref:GntR family transcriptional regulator n=1 Tax=Desulfococcus sp. TaxID=2025834 RepID=UPI0035942CC1